MAEAARPIESSAARKIRGASPVRVVRNLPNAQMAENDNARARNFIRERQGNILPTITQRPANDNADEEESDVYGATQRASEERMREVNAGDAEQDLEDDQYINADDSQEYQNNEQPLSAPELDYRRAREFNRQRAADAFADENEESDEADSATEIQSEIKKAAIKKAAQRKLIKAGFGATGIGLIVTLLIWDYEVFIERKAPTWKIFLVVVLHGLTFILFLLQILAPIILIVAVLYGAREMLPESVRGIVDSLFSSI